MSIEILYDLEREVRRLFIAGSGMAAGDMGLRRLLPRLQKLGEAAPVFKRFAQAVEELAEAGREVEGVKLLELGTLLYSVLYTQGRTESEGDLASVEGTEIEAGTRIPYRKLSPVLTALTQRGQGRLEAIRQAQEEGLLGDLRVIPAAVAALDDSYPEIAEFVHQKVIPGYGRDALPVLRMQLRLNGGRGNARRLELLHRLLGEDSKELLLQAAREGSAEVRAAAVELLGAYPDQEPFLLEQADEKRKETRTAAYTALAVLGSERARQRLLQALDGKDRELAIEPVRRSPSGELTRDVVRHAEAALKQFLSDTDREEAIARIHADLLCLQGKKAPEILPLLQRLLSAEDFMVPGTERIQEEAARLLLELDSPEAYGFALELQTMHRSRFIALSFEAAVRTLPAKEVYERFAPELRNNRSSAAKELLRVMKERIPDIDRQVEGRPDAGEWTCDWDPRWVPLLIEADEGDLVARLARQPDQGTVEYLMHKCREQPDFHKWGTVELLLALFRLGAKETPELLMGMLEKPGGRPFYYLDRTRLLMMELLPASYADRLHRFGEAQASPGLKHQVLEIAESVRSKPVESESDKRGTGLWGWLKNRRS